MIKKKIAMEYKWNSTIHTCKQDSIWNLNNAQIAFRVPEPKYIRMKAPKLMSKCVSIILMFQEEGKKELMFTTYNVDKIHNSHFGMRN
jgi:hypothetical protein